MAKEIQVFISYKNNDRNYDQVALLEAYLTQPADAPRYKVFWDKKAIKPSDDWKKTIKENIPKSDVLILLLTADILTEKGKPADWVLREVTLARINQVPILALLIYPNEADSIQQVLDELDIADIQWFLVPYKQPDAHKRYQEVIENIDRLIKESGEILAKSIAYLTIRKKDIDALDPANHEAKPFEQKKSSYAYHHHTCHIHLAVGDILDLAKVDVLVNSENDYMQMGRIWERSVSAQIRYAGARRNGPRGPRILEDLIQDELSAEIKKRGANIRNVGEKGTPIGITQVLVTSAGNLNVNNKNNKKTNFRYVFHVASVTVSSEKEGFELKKLTGKDKLKDCVINCLDEIKKVQKSNPASAPIKSIVFPLLCTGPGGAPSDHVANAMINGIKNWLESNPNTSLEHIYLCAYTLGDVENVTQQLIQNFPKNP